MNHTLVPVPRHLSRTSDTYPLPTRGRIAIGERTLLFEGEWIQQACARHGYTYDLALQAEGAVIRLALAPDLPPQAYRLTVNADGAAVTGGDAAGVFYGLATLRQLLQQDPTHLPGLHIDDAPDYAVRAYLLDISRDRVPTLAALYQLVDELAALKFNQLQLYTEHTFAYPGHEVVWRHADPLTPQDILLLDRRCRQRHIELVPNQNSLGHMERWLQHPAYRQLAESPEGFVDHDGKPRGPSTLAPLDPGSLALMTSLYDALLPHFTSRQVNVGCDEPWELGRGRSRDAVAARGGRVYLDWLLDLQRALQARGHRMMFWGDIIIKYPHLVPELPEGSIVLEWGYEAAHPFEDHCARYAAAGVPFYVCPGTSSWNSLVGRASNTVANVQGAARAGLNHGAAGLLLTDWGDNGHWQPYPVSYIGMVAAAAFSWSAVQAEDLDIAAALTHCVYADSAGVMGPLTWRLADLYRRVGPEAINGQVLAYALQWPPEEIAPGLRRVQDWGGAPADTSADTLREVTAEVDAIIPALDGARIDRPDADLLRQEWAQAAGLLRHGARWLLFNQGAAGVEARDLLAEWETLIAQQRAIWLARSRRGGLEDSMRRFEPLRQAYMQRLT